MSKVTFRAKALEHSRKMAIYVGDEIPEMTDFAIVNRTVPELPSGMEKEEETQHHLQKALSAQQACGSISNLIIPIPELRGADHYERIYSTKAGFTVSKKFIHVQPSTTDQELPDYDMDTEDESWLDSHKSIYGDLDSDPVRFENMVDKLEKGSGHLVVKLNEAKALIKEKEDVVIAVYDYWLSKRLRQEKRVKEVLAAKAENLPILPAPQSSTVNPYLAFRKRAEKMQTRKNRKNDEQSYLGILQLRRSFEKAKALLDMLKMREGYKKGLMETKRSIFEKRHELKDWTGELVRDSERNIGPVHLPDMSHLFAQSTLDDDHTVQKHGSNRFASTVAISGSDLERPRKRRKYRKLAKSQLRQAWQDGSDVASDDVGDDDHADGDVECKIKNSHSTGSGEREELDRLSSVLSFFNPSSKTIASSFSYDADVLGDASSGNFLSDNSEDDASPDGRYTFKRKEGCYYQAPLPYKSLAEGHNLPMFANQVFAPDMLQVGRGFSVATLPNLPMSGYVRQRAGRGGRVIIDRISTASQKSGLNDDPNVHSPCSTFHLRHRKTAHRGRHGNSDSSGHCKGLNKASLLSHSEPDDSTKGIDRPDRMSDVVGATCHDPLKRPQHPCASSERIDFCNHEHGVEVFPTLSVKSLMCSSSSPVISLPLLPSMKTTIRNSRASILFGSNFSALVPGHKRKCSNRTDSEDSGVCSPSPTPSSGSLPGTNPTSEVRHSEIRNGHPLAVTDKTSENSKGTSSSSVSPMEVDDGISDDHSTNGDSCGSFSDHKPRSSNSSSSCSPYLVESGLNVRENRLEQNNKISFTVEHKRPKVEVIPEVKDGSAQLVRKHLSSFDSGKFSLLTSKMSKEGSSKVSTSQVESNKSVGRNNSGLRYQCQLKVADVNNLVSLNGEVVTALEVS